MLPVGTANLVSREVALPLTREADVLFEGIVRALPWTVGLLEIHRAGALPERAVATVGAGLDGEIVHRVARARAGASTPGAGGYRRWVGPITGALGGGRFPLVEATLDGRRTYRGTAVVLQHARAYGGVFSITPDARLDSDVIDVVVVRSRSRRDLLRLLVGAWRSRLSRYHDVVHRRATEVWIRARDPVSVQADGDPAGTTDLFVRLLPRSLTLLRAAA
jgi:diacylglycerol kinase family enzyme